MLVLLQVYRLQFADLVVICSAMNSVLHVVLVSSEELSVLIEKTLILSSITHQQTIRGIPLPKA